jgi:hypothetical protein
LGEKASPVRSAIEKAKASSYDSTVRVAQRFAKTFNN